MNSPTQSHKTGRAQAVRLGVVAGSLIAFVGPASSAPAATYTFIKVADNSGTPFTSFGASSISSNGTVAFFANHITDDGGVFTGNGGPITKIADVSGQFKGFVGFPTINAGGAVAFHAILDNDERGIYSGNGGPTTTIADATGPLSGFTIFGLDSSPAINDGGAVAFRAGLDAGGEGIFVGSGGPLTTFADSSGSFEFFEHLPDLNAAGTVVFQATLDAGGRGVFTGVGGPTATIADSSGPFNLLLGPAINDGGEVAFATQFDNHFMPNIHLGVIKGSGGPTTTFADLTLPSFSNIRPPVSINSSGAVLFRGDLGLTTQGIYTGANAAADKVIASGDPLFGSTVLSLGFVYRSLSDGGDVAFNYSLQNGENGVAIAHPVPEPSSSARSLRE